MFGWHNCHPTSFSNNYSYHWLMGNILYFSQITVQLINFAVFLCTVLFQFINLSHKFLFFNFKRKICIMGKSINFVRAASTFKQLNSNTNYKHNDMNIGNNKSNKNIVFRALRQCYTVSALCKSFQFLALLCLYANKLFLPFPPSFSQSLAADPYHSLCPSATSLSNAAAPQKGGTCVLSWMLKTTTKIIRSLSLDENHWNLTKNLAWFYESRWCLVAQG